LPETGSTTLVVTSSQPNQNTWGLAFCGKLTFSSRQAYQAAVNQAEAASPSQIIFDFTDLSYIDSAGLGLMTLTHRKLTASGITIILANSQKSVKDILLLTNMERMFTFHESVAVAFQPSQAVFSHQ